MPRKRIYPFHLAAVFIGVLALPIHAVTTFLAMLGTNLTTQPGDPLPDRANTLWTIALYGSIVALIALGALVWHFSWPTVFAYTVVWTILLGAFGAGMVLVNRDATSPDTGRTMGWILFDGVPILATIVCAWIAQLREHPPEEDGTP